MRSDLAVARRIPVLQLTVQKVLLGLIQLRCTGIKRFTPMEHQAVQSLLKQAIKGKPFQFGLILFGDLAKH